MSVVIFPPAVVVNKILSPNYRPFQNHYTQQMIMLESFRGLQSQFSGVFELAFTTITDSFLVLPTRIQLQEVIHCRDSQ